MEKDISLKTRDEKLVILVLGNESVGKKSLVQNWMKIFKLISTESKSFYKNYIFSYTIESFPNPLIIEVRILNSDEIDTELKLCLSFFKYAYGAIIISSVDDNQSFAE